MSTELTNPGDKLIGKRIYAQFRKWEPHKNHITFKEDSGLVKHKYALVSRVYCRIEVPLKKKKT